MCVFPVRTESPDHGLPVSILYIIGVEGGVCDYTMAGAGASKLCVVARKAHNHQVALLMQKSCCLITKILLEEAKIKELTEELQEKADVTASPRLGTHASSQILLEYLSFLSPLCQFNHSPNPCSWVFPIKHFHSEDPRTSSTKNNLNLNLKLNTFHLTFSLNYSLLINSGSPTFLIHKLYAHCEDRFSPAFDRCAVCRTGQKISIIPPARAALSGRTLYPESVCWAYPFSSCTIVKFILKRFFCILKFYHFFSRWKQSCRLRWTCLLFLCKELSPSCRLWCRGHGASFAFLRTDWGVGFRMAGADVDTDTALTSKGIRGRLFWRHLWGTTAWKHEAAYSRFCVSPQRQFHEAP